ncbi:MAG: cytochrome P450 [Simkaniaceae bacterium]|nr:cytochrome P450 [Simkaniaceae bacterium]
MPGTSQQLCQKSSSSPTGSCPYSSSNKSTEAAAAKSYTVSFEPFATKKFHREIISFVKEIYSRVSPSSIKSAWYIGTQNDLSQPLLRSWKSGSYVSEFTTPAGTVYVTADPVVMRAVFANSRKEPTGIFYDYENKRLFVDGILKDLYPDDIQKIGSEKAVDMLVISAAAPHAAILRGPMIKALGPSAISVYSNALSDIATKILKDLTENERKNCDASQISFEYAVTVISKLFTGYETTRESYQKLAKALDAFSKRMTRIVSHRPATIEEEKDYSVALSEMKTTIEGCLSSPSSYIKGLMDAGWNDFQIKSNLFFLYFAGTETTASSMNYLIWQLGRAENSVLQQEIRDPKSGQKILLKAIAETLRIHPPAFIEGRQLREDTLMTIKDKNHNLLWSKQLRKDHSIVCLTQAAGRDPNLYPEPEQFNPYRFHDKDSRIAALSFLPFGSGPHTCPGQHLALAELQAFTYCILTHFSVRTLSPEKIDQKGFFTLRATPARIQLTSLK